MLVHDISCILTGKKEHLSVRANFSGFPDLLHFLQSFPLSSRIFFLLQNAVNAPYLAFPSSFGCLSFRIMKSVARCTWGRWWPFPVRNPRMSRRCFCRFVSSSVFFLVYIEVLLDRIPTCLEFLRQGREVRLDVSAHFDVIDLSMFSLMVYAS